MATQPTRSAEENRVGAAIKIARYADAVAMLVVVPVAVVLLPDAFGELLVFEIFLAINFVALMYNSHSVDPRSTWEGARAMFGLALVSAITTAFNPSLLAMIVLSGSVVLTLAYVSMAFNGTRSEQENTAGE